MKVTEVLQGVGRVFLDTAPIVYFVERNAAYLERVQPVFTGIDEGTLVAVTSPVTLAECLIIPIQHGLGQLQQDFIDLIVNGINTLFMAIDQDIAQQAAQLRASYNLSLTDAFQISVALNANCEAFLTNDAQLKRVKELNAIILDEVEAS